MADVNEGRLSFHFPDDWQVIKYDDSLWHTSRLRSRLKAMDILLRNPEGEHYWIEIKDCLGFEPDNRPRLSPTDSKELSATKHWLAQQGWAQQIQAERKKPFIVDEVEEKLRSTLAALTIAQREQAAELQDFYLVEEVTQSLTAILLLTWDAKDFKRLASRLQLKLERCLQPYGVRCFVVNEHTLHTTGIDCRITRSKHES